MASGRVGKDGMGRRGWASGRANSSNPIDNPDHASDRIIVCQDCGSPFTYSVGEQGFYGRLRLLTPTRCVSCRAARKLKYQRLKDGGS